MPAWWAFPSARPDGEKRAAFLKACGLQERSDELLKWVSDCEALHEVLYPNVICRLAVAREFSARFSIDTRDWHLIGIGLNRALLESFLAEFKPAAANVWVPPFYEMLSKNRTLESGAHLRGYDVLGLDTGSTVHSWLCNGLEARAHSFGIHVNFLGLLETYADAEKVAQDASDPETGAEPVPWYPWMVVEYPI